MFKKRIKNYMDIISFKNRIPGTIAQLRWMSAIVYWFIFLLK